MSGIPTFTTQAQILAWAKQFAGTGASMTTLLIAKTPHGIETVELDIAAVLHDATADLVPLPDREKLKDWLHDHGQKVCIEVADALLDWMKDQPIKEDR